MRETLYDHAGGEPAMIALATAHHARCLADPELNHPFSHPDGQPDHVRRLAVYWGEVLAGNGDLTDLGRRFVVCFVAAADDAGLPADAEFRTQLRAYMTWAVADVLTWSDEGAVVPGEQSMPRWTWDGLAVTG